MAAQQRKSRLIPEIPGFKDWHAVLAFALLTCVFFRDIIFRQAFFWEDFLYQFVQIRSFAASSLARGELPLWNPYTFAGMPFQADIQSAIFYIPNLVLTLFVSGGRLSYYWVELSILAHYVVAGAGMYWLARDYGLGRAAALLAGLVFMLSGFMVTHAIHMVILEPAAWVPLILFAFRRATLGGSLGWTIGGGLILGHAVFGGSPQITLYTFFLLFCCFLFEFAGRLRRGGLKAALRLVLPAAGMVVLAVAVTAVQLLPTMELASWSQRAEMTFAKSQEGKMAFAQLITAVAPKFFGSSGAQGSTWWGEGPYWTYWETCFYVGIPALILAAVALTRFRRNRDVVFYGALVLFGILYSVGDQFFLHGLFYSWVPEFDKFRSIGRMTLLSTVGLAFLAGSGLETFFALATEEPKKALRIAAAAGGGFVLLWLAVKGGFLQSPSDPNFRPQAAEIAASAMTTALLLGLASAGLLFLAARGSLKPVTAILLVVALQFVDMHLFGFAQNNGDTDPDAYFARSEPLVARLHDEGAREYFRINARYGGAMIMDRNQGMLDRVFMMEGYTPLALQRVFPPAPSWAATCDIMNAKYRIAVDEQQRTTGVVASTSYLPRAFVVYDVKAAPGEKEERALMESPSFDPRRTAVVEEGPAAADGADSLTPARITSYGINALALDVEAKRNGMLVLSEVWYPGWTATVDGAEAKVLRADWSLRGIPVAAGRHTVEVRYEPAPFRRGAVVTLVALLAAAAGLAAARFRGGRGAAPPPEAA